MTKRRTARKQRATAPRPCKVCVHAKRVEIERLRGLGETVLVLAETFGLSVASLYRHERGRHTETHGPRGEVLALVSGSKVALAPAEAAKVAPVPAAWPGLAKVAPAPAAGSGLTPVVRRILESRNPLALEEVEAGILVSEVGVEAFSRWLSRPILGLGPVAERDDEDNAVVARRLCAQIVRSFEREGPEGVKANAWAKTALDALARLEAIEAKRPKVETEDELLRRVRVIHDDVLAMLETTISAEERMAAGP